MLDVLAMLLDQCRAEGGECLSKLRNEFCADKLFDRCLLFCFAVYIDLKLRWVSCSALERDRE